MFFIFTKLYKIFPNIPPVYYYLAKDLNHKIAQPVDQVAGSFFLVRRQTIEEIGPFDERFFIYFEDIDLCRRFWGGGWQVIYNPDAVITHNHARQSARTPWYKFFKSIAAWHHLASWIKYLWKWKGK